MPSINGDRRPDGTLITASVPEATATTRRRHELAQR
jgi:hypothetical protein